MLEMLKSMAYVNTATAKILPDPNYSLTLDNFYKMCLIVLRMRANIPIIVMGETGVGKTALIRYLVENVFRDQLKLFDIHAGVAESHLIGMVKEIR
jgi:midasin (ATPase involved in ribosome maturation)